MSAPAVARAPGFLRATLHLGGLWALAFAQPLLDLLGRNATFFVARNSARVDILVLALGYALVPPLAGGALVWVLGRVRPVLGQAALLGLVALLVAALALPPLGDALGGSAAAVPVALAAGAAAAALYARAAGVRAFVGVLSIAPAVVVLLFLVVSPVRELVLPGDARGSVAGPARSATPIVHVILDELPTSSIQAADGTIDARLFPNLARFARDATWYRNATTVDDLTSRAVPAQLTGTRAGEDEIPTVRDFPRNLFTLFGRSHDLTVIEPITDLCPERLCSDERPGTAARLNALRSDLTVVAQHLLLPDDLRDGLPRIDGAWEDFEAEGAAPGDIPGGEQLQPNVVARLRADDATAGFERAVSALDRPRSRPPLVFVHSTLPHGPWRFLPDGREYALRRKAYPGLEENWGRRQWLVDQGFQRHLLQASYADRLVGRLLDKLRATGSYDDAVIVIAADHGGSFRARRPRRPVTSSNVSDIALVPLLVKPPGQRRGGVDDRAVRTLDVLPTIAAAAGAGMPWRTDGMPVWNRRVDPAARIDIAHAGAPALAVPLRVVTAHHRRREAVEARLLRHGLYGFGPRPDLLGRRIAGIAAPSPGGTPRATIDGARDYAAVKLGSRFLPAYVAGRVEGLRADTPLAVAVNGRIVATTRAYPGPSRMLYGAMIPPSSLAAGANAVAVLEVRAGDRLRALAATGAGTTVRTAAPR